MNYFVHRQEMSYNQCEGVLHEIRKSDTLYRLSRFYKVSIDDIMEKNPMIDVYNLKIGDKLCIPMKYKTYHIQRGDTLDDLLKRFRMDYESFRKANPQMTSLILPENEVVFLPENRKDSMT